LRHRIDCKAPFLDDIPLGWLLTALAVLLVLSGFFSAAETSLMAVNRYRLKHLANRGHRGAKLTLLLLDKTDKLLGVVLLGNNLLNAASAALVTVIAIRLFDDSELMLTAATLTVTFLILVFSEVTPKILGAAYPERVAIPSSFILTPLLRLFYPVIWFVNLFVRTLLWLLRIKPAAHGASAALNMEELRTLVLEGGHYIPPKHQSILANLFALENTTVADVMTPRNQLEAVDLDAPEETLREQVITCHHSRLLVYREKLDNVLGVVQVRKLLHRIHSGEIDAQALEETMREPYFIPASTSLLAQMQLFQENQRRTGLVVDEYGELLGLVSLDDILEEIVGEFTTIAPGQLGTYRRQDDGSWLVDGASQLRDLNRKLKLDLPLDGPKTLNGLILEHFEDIPEAGTSFKLAGHTMEILQTQDRAVKVVQIFPAATPTE
jgi:Mg2+/Co2+ transporter CorB